MENAKQQLVDRIKSASNVLVTVGRNPSVDALSALLGLTLVLNKQGKHAAAVFSGQVPSTIEFLQPDETIEKNTDSLRDFIIALDKNKADKLRYKVEDNVVRIFITPYKTSISQEDFEFSEGDFNIDVVIALGVLKQEDLDEAITAHGRILHDATVASINIMPDGGLGSINWYEPQASSLSELVTDLTQMLGANLLDEQIATALLTGIVAETDRCSNDKTSSVAMSMSAALMKAGANQQLVASKLEGQLDVNGPTISDESQSGDGNNQPSDGSGAGDQSLSQDNGAIQIDHSESSSPTSTSPDSEQSDNVDNEAPLPEINTNGTAEVTSPPPQDGIVTNNLSTGPKLMTEPPTLGGTLTANSTQPDTEPLIDPLSLSSAEAHQAADQNGPTDDVKAPDLPPLPSPSAPPLSPPPSSAPSPVVNAYLPPQVPAATPALTAPPPNWTPPPSSPPPTAAPAPSLPPASPIPAPPVTPTLDPATLGDLEKDDTDTRADIEHAVSSTHVKEETVDEARDEVNRAYNDSTVGADEALPAIDALNAQQLGGALHSQDSPSTDSAQPPSATDSTAPPPVPPPIPFQFGNPPPA